MGLFNNLVLPGGWGCLYIITLDYSTYGGGGVMMRIMSSTGVVMDLIKNTKYLKYFNFGG